MSRCHLAPLLLVLVACGRTGFDRPAPFLPIDAGIVDASELPTADAVEDSTLPGDIEPPDSGADSARPSDATSDPTPDILSDTMVGRPGCPPYPVSPTVLFSDSGLRAGRLAVSGNWLYFGAMIQDEQPGPPEAGIFRLPVVGGSVESVEIEASYLSGPLLLSERWIVFAHSRTVSTGAESWSTSYPELAAYDRQTGGEVRIDNGGDVWAGTKAFALAAEDQLYFGFDRSMEETGLAAASLETGEWSLELAGEDVRELYVQGETPYWYVPLSPRGGSLRTLGPDGVTEILETGDFNCCDMIGVDQGEIYFFRGDADRIDAVRPDGTSRVVAEGVDDMGYHTALGAEHVYWGHGAEVSYVPRSGGAPRTIARTDNGWVEGVAVDECAVFWSQVNPPRIMVRARP